MTALLLLLVMTILSITVMQMSRVQERMAGNTRDLNVAFETAEAAARDGEQRIYAQTAPVFCSAVPCTMWDDGSFTDVADQSQTWWDTNALQFADKAGNAMTGVSRNPQIIIEHVALVRTDGDVALGIPPKGRDFFRITARSTGASGLTNTVVQTTLARKF